MELQRLNHFVDVSIQGISLSRLETFILVELDADNARGIVEFATLMRVDRSTISRSLTGLTKKGLVRGEKAENSRFKCFCLTSKGLKIVRAIDERADTIVENLSKEAGHGVLGKVVYLFDEIADALDEPKALKRPHESRYRAEQRRITRAFGLLNEYAFDTGLSHLAFHTLLAIKDNGRMKAVQIAELLNTQMASVSVAVKTLERKKLINREACKVDKRSSFLSITLNGDKLLLETQNKTATSFANSLTHISTKKLRIYVEAFERLVHGKQELGANASVRTLNSPQDRSRARAFALRELVALGKEESCPEMLFPSSALNFGLFEGEELVAVEQWVRGLKNGITLELAVNVTELEPKSLRAFRNVTRKRVLEN